LNTTAIMVEALIAGILVLLALLLLAMSVFPSEVQTFFIKISNSQSLLAEAPLLVIVIAIAYGFGVLFEFIGLIAFEWWFDKIKRNRLIEYLNSNRSIIAGSPILKKYVNSSSKKVDVKEEEARSCIGTMRFYVLMKNSALYSEIESQMNRLRLIRVLFLVELILLFAIGGQLLQKFSLSMFSLWMLVVVIAIANIEAIRKRFHRYCRAIERSYQLLMLEQNL